MGYVPIDHALEGQRGKLSSLFHINGVDLLEHMIPHDLDPIGTHGGCDA